MNEAEPLVQAVRPNIVDGRGRPLRCKVEEPQREKTRVAPWQKDIATEGFLHNINGHWFEVVGMSPAGLFLKYDHPSRKVARKMKQRETEAAHV